MTFPATMPGAALASRAATTGLAVAFLALGSSGAVTIAAAATGAHSHTPAPATSTTKSTTPNTGNGTATAFGQQVKAQVATCKANLQSGQHGIGSCVSAFATAHNPSNTNSTGAAAAHKQH